MSRAINDVVTLSGRCLRMSFRNLDIFIISVCLPVMMMFLFVFILGAGAPDRLAYINGIVPSILILSVGYCSSLTAGIINSDMQRGVIDRFRSMPLFQPAVLTGHVVASAVRNAVGTVLIIGVAFAIGFRPQAGPAGWLGVTGILFLFMLVITWTSVFFGLITKSPEAAGSFGFVMLFLPYISSGFTRLEYLPGGLRAFATHQPLTPIIESLRGLTMGIDAGGYIIAALIWCVGLLAVMYILSVRAYRRKVG